MIINPDGCLTFLPVKCGSCPSGLPLIGQPTVLESGGSKKLNVSSPFSSGSTAGVSVGEDLVEAAATVSVRDVAALSQARQPRRSANAGRSRVMGRSLY